MKKKILVTIASIAIILASFFAGRELPNRHNYLSLNEINKVSIVDDNVIIIVLDNGHHYALEADKKGE